MSAAAAAATASPSMQPESELFAVRSFDVFSSNDSFFLFASFLSSRFCHLKKKQINEKI